jgi:hypothetical protein
MIEMINKMAIQSGVATALTLVGGMLLGIGIGNVLFESLPGHMLEPARIGLAAIPALAGTLGGGGAWGWLMARLAQTKEKWRMVWAGVFGYSLPVIVMIFALLGLELALTATFERVGQQALPTHVVFTLLFVPTAFLIAATAGGALGVALRHRMLAWRLALSAGAAAGLAFLAVDLVMDTLGWRVGAPGAAERFTMLTVLMASSVGAALIGGTAMGVILNRYVTDGGGPRSVAGSQNFEGV